MHPDRVIVCTYRLPDGLSMRPDKPIQSYQSKKKKNGKILYKHPEVHKSNYRYIRTNPR